MTLWYRLTYKASFRSLMEGRNSLANWEARLPVDYMIYEREPMTAPRITPVKTGPETGIKATSTKLALGTGVSGLGVVILGFLNNAATGSSNYDKVIGAVMACVSLGGKLWHDRGLRLADITANAGAAGGDIETLRSDLAAALNTFVAADPAAKSVVSTLEGRLSDLTTRYSDLQTKVEGEIKAVEPSFETIVEMLKKALGPNAALLQGIPQGPAPT